MHYCRRIAKTSRCSIDVFQKTKTRKTTEKKQQKLPKLHSKQGRETKQSCPTNARTQQGIKVDKGVSQCQWNKPPLHAARMHAHRQVHKTRSKCDSSLQTITDHNNTSSLYTEQAHKVLQNNKDKKTNTCSTSVTPTFCE